MKYLLQKILNESGSLLKKRYILSNNVKLKSKSTNKDIVTSVDEELEEFIIRKINQNFSNVTIISEEFNKHNVQEFNNSKCFIIDPIDGTNNFIQKIPFFSISIAYSENGVIKAGGVFNPILDEMFLCEEKKGAFLNNKRIFVSKTDKLIKSIVATGFGCLRANLQDNNIKNLINILPKTRGVRRAGSAALDLCYTACGRYDAFWEMNLNIWDIAAGILLVQEAGGRVSDFQNGNNHIFDKKILATNNIIHDELVGLL